MNEKEKRILSILGRVLPVMPEFEKGRLLGVAETMALMKGISLDDGRLGELRKARI